MKTWKPGSASSAPRANRSRALPAICAVMAVLSVALFASPAFGQCTVPVASAPALPTDTVWFEDDVPPNAVLGGTWIWDMDQKAGGSQSHTEPAAEGMHEHSLEVYPENYLWVSSSDVLVVYVMLDPCDPPNELMLQFNVSGDGWEHRAYWGEDAITDWGTNGTVSRRSMGPLPPTGRWVRLEIPASAVGLGNRYLIGMSFALNNGAAWFDRPGKAGTCMLGTVPPPSVLPGDTVWFDDAIPPGSDGYETWLWDQGQKMSGAASHTQGASYQAYERLFYANAEPLYVAASDTIVQYVLLDPCETPREVMLQFGFDNWEHRAYWGDDLLDRGTPGTQERRYMGPLPPAGTWARLEIPASLLGIQTDQYLGAMSYVLSGGRAWFDGTGKSSAPLPSVSAVTLAPGSVVGGSTATATITLSAVAPATGAVISVSSSDSSVATVPTFVTVPAGQTSTTFTVSSLPVTSDSSTTIGALYLGLSQTASLGVTAGAPATLSAVSFTPTSVSGGTNATGTVTLTAAAPAGGASVALASSDPLVAAVAASVLVPAGQTSADFTVTTYGVPSASSAMIFAGYLGGSKAAWLSVTTGSTISLVSVTVNPVSVAGGTAANGTVALSGQALAGGISIGLSSNSGVVGVPSSVAVPEGASTATFSISTSTTPSDLVATVSGTHAGVTRSAILLVGAEAGPSLVSLAFNPSSVASQSPSTGTVTLSLPARPGGAVVSLSSDNDAVTVPNLVSVAGGATGATFEATTTNVTESTAVTVSGSFAGETQTAVLTVQPCVPPEAVAPSSFPSTDVVWFDDELPPNSDTSGVWEWDSSQKASGLLSHTEPTTSGPHQRFAVTDPDHGLYVGAGDSLVAYVLLSSCDPPREVMLQFRVDNVDYRAYWGEDLVDVGPPEERHAMGPLPTPGQWVRLEVPAALLGIGGRTVVGAGFTLYDGQAWFDRVGKTSACAGMVSPPSSFASDTVWFDDDPPTGATEHDVVWDTNQHASGTRSHTHVQQYGEHQHFFEGMPPEGQLNVSSTDTLVVYALVDACDPPQEIYIRWYDGSWEHGAYWGADLIDLGTQGTTGRVPRGAIPDGGQWTRLEIPASILGMNGGNVSLIQFVTFSGRVWFDRIGKISTAEPAELIGLSLSPSSVTGGTTATGTVSLSRAAPAGGVSVALSSDDIAASVPPSVAIPEGSTSATFAVTTTAVSSSALATITAAYSSVTKTAPLTVNPPESAGLTSVSLNPASVLGGASSTGTIQLDGPAPAGGAAVSLSSNNAAAVVPASATVAQGATSTTFGVTTSAVATTQSASITGSYMGATRSGALEITAGPCTVGSATAPSSFPATDSVWIDEELPPNSSTSGIWQWDPSQKASGLLSNTEPPASGPHQHFVQTDQANGLYVAPTDSLVAYVLLNPCDPPREVMLQFRVDNVDYKAYWGEDLVNVGAPAERHEIGSLPTSGQWARLEIPVSLFGIGGRTVVGAVFTLYDGQAWFDRIGKTTTCGAGTVAPPESFPADTVWVDDDLPAGATGHRLEWDSTQHASGTRSHTHAPHIGQQDHFFDGVSPEAQLHVESTDTLVVYALIDPCDPSDEIYVRWYDGSWEHGAYWGSDLINLGTPGTSGRVNRGALPTPGQWTRLEVPAALLGMDGSDVSLVQFVTYNGRVWFDRDGKAPPPVPHLSSLSLAPTSVAGGTTSVGTVTLLGPALTGGFEVSLSSDHAAASVPATITVASGTASATFNVTTTAVAVQQSATITASAEGISRTALLTVMPPQAGLSNVSLSPASILGGSPSTGTVSLTLPAPAGGFFVALSSDNGAASVPPSLLVAEGASSATFTVTTSAVANVQTVTISATASGVTRTASLSVTPPPPSLASISVSPASVAGGSTATATVTLTTPAVPPGFSVNASSDNPQAMTPAGITVSPGQSSAWFTIVTTTVTSTASAVITASANGVTKTAPLTITPSTAGVLSGTVLLSSGGSIAPGSTVTVNEIGATGATNAVGAYAFTLPPGSYTVTGTRAGYQSSTTSAVLVTAGNRTMAPALSLVKQTGTMTGTITNGTTPVGGAMVSIHPSSSASPAWAATTQADGTFSIALPADAYEFRVSKLGYVDGKNPGGLWVVVSSNQTASAGTIVLSAGGTITGVVRNRATNAPVAGATLQFAGSSPKALTDATGRFSFGTLPYISNLSVGAEGYADLTSRSYTVTVGQVTTTDDVLLEPNAARLTGRVVLEAGGDAVLGATAKITGTSTSATTNAAGEFALAVPQGTYTLTVGKFGYGDVVSSAVAVVTGQAVDMGTFQLRQRAVVSGVVVNSVTGTGVNATVTTTGTGVSGGTNGGVFNYWSPPGLQTFTATAVGYEARTTAPYDLPEGGDVDLGVFTLAGADVPAVPITGVLKDAVTLNPIAGVSVTPLGTFNSVTTDAQGRFTLSRLPGTHALTYLRAGYAEGASLPFVVLPGAPLALEPVLLSPLATVTGTVLNHQGGSLIDFPVKAKGTKYSALTGPAGDFTLTLPAGTSTIQADEPASVIYESQVTLAPGESRALGTIRLTQEAGFTATGMPAGSYHQVPVTLTAVSSATTVTGPPYLRVPPGTYTVTVSATGWLPQTFGPITITPGIRQDLGQVTLVRGGSLVGTVTSSADGTPIANASVSAGGASAVTDPYGYFQLSLAEGAHSVTVAKAGFSPITTAPQNVVQAAETSAGAIALEPQAVPPGTISGTVIDAFGGSAVNGAAVSLIGVAGSATTDASGAFSIQAAPGSYSVLVTKAGWATVATAPVTLLSNATASAGTIAMSSVAGTATGAVIDVASLTGIPGAVVAVSGTTIQTTTDASGHFTLSLAPGTYSISASRTGWYAPSVAAFTVGPSVSVNAGSLWMRQGATFTGRVVNSYGGAGIEGVLVRTPYGAEARTNASGGFHLFVPSTTALGALVPLTSFNLTKPNWTGLSTLSVHPVSPGASVDIGTLVLDGKVSISGVVRYHHCQTCPVSATVSVTGSPDATITSGSFQLQNAPGEGITLTVKNLGAYDLVTAPFDLESGYPIDVGSLYLLFPASVGGRVLDSNTGAGVAGATVIANPQGISTTSAADGSYGLTVMPGPVTFVVSKSGYPTKSIPLEVPDITALWNPQNFYLDSVDNGALQSVAFTTPSVAGGTDASLLIRLTQHAPLVGARISLSSSNGSVMGFPAGDFGYPADIIAIIAAGFDNSVFPAHTAFVTQDTPVTVTASYGGVTMTATTTVLAPPASLIGVAPGWVLPGDVTPVLYGTGIQPGSTVTFLGPVYTLSDPLHPLCPVAACPSSALPATVGSGHDYAAFAIPPGAAPGIYYLKVRSASGVDSSNNQWIAVDSIQQSRLVVPPDQHSLAQQIFPGQTVTGTLSGDNPQGDITDYNYYYFTATAGTRISISMSRVDTSMTWENPASLDPQVEVIAPDGFIYSNLQAFDNQPGVDFDASLAGAILPQTGLYIIVAETTRGSGQYRLSFTVDSMAPAPVGNRAIPITGNHNTLPLDVPYNVQSVLLDSRGWPVAGAAYAFTSQNQSGDTGTASFQTGASGTTSVNGAAYGTVKMTTQGKARFKATLSNGQLSQLTYLPSSAAAAAMGGVFDEAAGELEIPVYPPAAISSVRVLGISANGARLSDGRIQRLPQEQLQGRVEVRPTTGARAPQAAAASPDRAGGTPLRRGQKPLAKVRVPLVVSTCSGELEVFTQSGVTPATLNAPFTVVLTDVTPSEARGVVDTSTGIHGHRIEKADGLQRTLRLHLDVKDSTGNTPTHPVLVSLAVGGPRHGTLILDPEGSKIECAQASFIWHERDAQGNIIALNEEFEYRLGTLSTYSGAVPDPAHPGQVLPVWGVTERLEVTISTVDGSGNATPLTTFDAAFPVRPEPGRPHRFLSAFEIDGQADAGVWEYWTDYLTTTVGASKQSGLYRVYNSYYLVDRWGNVTFGHGNTTSPTTPQNLSVAFASQLAGGPAGLSVSFPGYETDVSWSNAGGSMPADTSVPLTVNVVDAEYGSWPVIKNLSLKFISGVHSALISQQDYDSRFGVEDGEWPMTVSPGATGAAIPSTRDSRNPDPAKQVTPKRLNFQIVTGTTVPRYGEVFESPHNVWRFESPNYALDHTESPDPHLEVSEPGRMKLSVVDSLANAVTDVEFQVHNCPRYDHQGPPNQPAQAGRPCADTPVPSTGGVIATYSINPAGSSRGYMGVELLRAPLNPGTYFIRIESLDSMYRIRQLPGLTVDRSAAGEFKGAFALCVVEAGEFLDQNFQRVHPYEVEQDTTAYFRYSNGGESPTATVTLQSKAEENATRVDTIDMPINRVGQSRTYLAGPFTLRPGLTGGAGGQLRSTRPLVSGDPALIVFPSFTDLFGLFGSKKVGSGFAIVPRKLRIDYLDENGQPQSPLLPPTVRVERLPDQPPYQSHNLYAEKTQIRVVATLPGTNEIDTTASGYAMLAEQPNTLVDPQKQLSYQGEKNATATRLSVFTDPQIADPTASHGQIPIVGGQSPLIKLYSLAGPRKNVNLTEQQTTWTAKLIARPTTVNVPRDFKDSVVNLIPQWSDQGSYGLAAGASQSSFTANPSGSGLPDWLEALSWDVIGQMRQGVGQADSYAPQVGVAALDVKAPEAGCSVPWWAFVCNYQQIIRYDTRLFEEDRLRFDSYDNTIYHGLLHSSEHFLSASVQHEARHCWQHTQPDIDLEKLPDRLIDAAEQSRASYLIDAPNVFRSGGTNPEFDFRGSGQSDDQNNDQIAARNDALERDAMRWEARNADVALGTGARCVQPDLVTSTSTTTPIYDLGTTANVSFVIEAINHSYNFVLGLSLDRLSGILVSVEAQTSPAPGDPPSMSGSADAKVTDPITGLPAAATIVITGNSGAGHLYFNPASGLNIYKVTVRHPNAAGDGAGPLMHACGFPDGPLYFKVGGN